MKIKNTRQWYDHNFDIYDTKVANFEIKDLIEIEKEINNVLNGNSIFKDYYSDIGYGVLAPKESELILKRKENNKLCYVFKLWNEHLLISKFEVIE